MIGYFKTWKQLPQMHKKEEKQLLNLDDESPILELKNFVSKTIVSALVTQYFVFQIWME